MMRAPTRAPTTTPTATPIGLLSTNPPMRPPTMTQPPTIASCCPPGSPFSAATAADGMAVIAVAAIRLTILMAESPQQELRGPVPTTGIGLAYMVLFRHMKKDLHPDTYRRLFSKTSLRGSVF